MVMGVFDIVTVRGYHWQKTVKFNIFSDGNASVMMSLVSLRQCIHLFCKMALVACTVSYVWAQSLKYMFLVELLNFRWIEFHDSSIVAPQSYSFLYHLVRKALFLWYTLQLLQRIEKLFWSLWLLPGELLNFMKKVVQFLASGVLQENGCNISKKTESIISLSCLISVLISFPPLPSSHCMTLGVKIILLWPFWYG